MGQAEHSNPEFVFNREAAIKKYDSVAGFWSPSFSKNAGSPSSSTFSELKTFIMMIACEVKDEVSLFDVAVDAYHALCQISGEHTKALFIKNQESKKNKYLKKYESWEWDTNHTRGCLNGMLFRLL